MLFGLAAARSLFVIDSLAGFGFGVVTINTAMITKPTTDRA